MKFLSGLMKKQPVRIDHLGEVRCNNGFSVIVQACDSSVDTDHGQRFMRHYNLLLQLPAGASAEEFLLRHGGKREWVQPDGTIALANFKGEGRAISEALEAARKDLQSYGIDLKAGRVRQLVSGDMKAHQHKFFKPLTMVREMDARAAQIKADRLNPQKVGEVNCEGGISYVISGYDSTLQVNGQDEPIRRYILAVRAGDSVLEEFIEKTGADRRNMRPDGTLQVMPPIPGQIDFFPQWLDEFSGFLKGKGYELPVQAIETAILRDMDHNPAQAHAPRPAKGR